MEQLRIQATLVAIAGVLALSACDRQGRPARAQAGEVPATAVVSPAKQAANLGPMETAKLLRQFRADQNYRGIEDYLEPEHKAIVISQLRAVDRLVMTTRLFRRRIQENLGLAASQEFRYDAVANIVGVLSRDVTLISYSRDGDRARLNYQIANRVPTEVAELVRRDERWFLVVDPIPGLPEQIFKLSELIVKAARRVERKTFTAEQLRKDIQLRQTPILRRIQRLVEEAEAHTTADATVRRGRP